MDAPAAPHGAHGIQEALTHKIGPFPGFVWALGVAGLLALYLHNKNGGTPAPTPGAVDPLSLVPAGSAALDLGAGGGGGGAFTPAGDTLLPVYVPPVIPEIPALAPVGDSSTPSIVTVAATTPTRTTSSPAISTPAVPAPIPVPAYLAASGGSQPTNLGYDIPVSYQGNPVTINPDSGQAVVDAGSSSEQYVYQPIIDTGGPDVYWHKPGSGNLAE